MTATYGLSHDYQCNDSYAMSSSAMINLEMISNAMISKAGVDDFLTKQNLGLRLNKIHKMNINKT